jgi:hypothetical protein
VSCLVILIDSFVVHLPAHFYKVRQIKIDYRRKNSLQDFLSNINSINFLLSARCSSNIEREVAKKIQSSTPEKANWRKKRKDMIKNRFSSSLESSKPFDADPLLFLSFIPPRPRWMRAYCESFLNEVTKCFVNGYEMPSASPAIWEHFL